MDDRSKFLATKKLCHSCLKSIKTHSARTCNRAQTSKVCVKNHPTSLQKKKSSQRQGQDGSKNPSNESPQEQIVKINMTACDESITCAFTSMKHQVISMCVVPVIITHMDSPKEIVIHAILDSCSQGTFVVEDLAEVLGIKGIETLVVVKTLTRDSKIKSTLVDGLVVPNLSIQVFDYSSPLLH